MTPISQATLQTLSVRQLHDLHQQWLQALSRCADGSEDARVARTALAMIRQAIARRASCTPRP